MTKSVTKTCLEEATEPDKPRPPVYLGGLG